MNLRKIFLVIFSFALMLSWGISKAVNSDISSATSNFSVSGTVSEVSDLYIIVNEAKGSVVSSDSTYNLNLEYLKKIETSDYAALVLSDIKVGDKIAAQGLTNGYTFFIKRIVSFTSTPSETAKEENATSTATTTESTPTASTTESVSSPSLEVSTSTESASTTPSTETASTTESTSTPQTATTTEVVQPEATTTDSVATTTDDNATTTPTVIETVTEVIQDVIETVTDAVQSVVEAITGGGDTENNTPPAEPVVVPVSEPVAEPVVTNPVQETPPAPVE
jgi:hypothetical protein